MKLADMTWDEAVQKCKGKIILIPHGSTEEHGYHLPLKTDAFVAEKICAEFYNDPNVIVAPVMQYTAVKSTKQMPGTVGMDEPEYDIFIETIIKDFEKLNPKYILFFLAHDGSMKRKLFDKLEKIYPKIKRMHSTQVRQKAVDKKIIETEGHAGEGETSLMLFLDEKNVKMSKAVDEEWPENYKDVGISKSGVCGWPTKSTKEKGKKLFEFHVSELRRYIDELE